MPQGYRGAAPTIVPAVRLDAEEQHYTKEKSLELDEVDDAMPAAAAVGNGVTDFVANDHSITDQSTNKQPNGCRLCWGTSISLRYCQTG